MYLKKAFIFCSNLEACINNHFSSYRNLRYFSHVDVTVLQSVIFHIIIYLMLVATTINNVTQTLVYFIFIVLLVFFIAVGI